MSQSKEQETAPAPREIPQLAEHLFRHESGKLVSVLTGIFGIDNLQLVEDVVQEALARALQTWPYYGIPQNPAAWITQTAKNLALDVLRRKKLFSEKQPQIAVSMEQWRPDEADSPMFSDEIKDRLLRLMFACCHPLISNEARIALALKTLCGFSAGEIATAFLTTEAAIAKRLTRARQKIRELRIPFEIPSGEELSDRLESVLQVLYLLFNEGYKASSGENLLKEELCHEAIRLSTLLIGHPAGDRPKTHALLALMLLNEARFATRLDEEGNILRLPEQDRSKWNRTTIERGIAHLSQAAAGDELSEYHLQAGIAACHCLAADYQATDWSRILAHYDRWLAVNDSPVIALNRAVAVAHVSGPAAGIAAVQSIKHRRQLKDYYLVYAVLGEFEAQLHNFSNASYYFHEALQRTAVKSEQSFLRQRLRECKEAIGTPSTGRGRVPNIPERI